MRNIVRFRLFIFCAMIILGVSLFASTGFEVDEEGNTTIVGGVGLLLVTIGIVLPFAMVVERENREDSPQRYSHHGKDWRYPWGDRNNRWG